jgi:hypothetical protein
MIRLAVSISAFLCQASALAAAPNLADGLWEITTAMDGGGSQAIQQCFSRTEIANFSQNMPQSGALGGGCQPAVQDLGTRATWTLNCAGPPKLSGSGEVSYSGNSFTASSKLNMEVQGQKVDIGQHVSGRRIGDCKK